MRIMPIYEYTCGRCGKDFELLVASAKAKAPAALRGRRLTAECPPSRRTIHPGRCRARWGVSKSGRGRGFVRVGQCR